MLSIAPASTAWRTCRSLRSSRFQAERKAGEFLGEIEVPKGNRYTGSMLVDLGLTKKESHRFQLLAKVPEAELVELIAGLP